MIENLAQQPESFPTGLLRFRSHPVFEPLVSFSVIIFLAYLADGIMTYVAPLFIDAHYQNSLLMGIILSVSSVVAIICDIIFPYFFRARRYLFYIWLALVLGLLYPFIYLFFPINLSSLLLGMLIWGAYFELLVFSNFHFIHAFVPHTEHSQAWGLLSSARTLAMLLAPLIASGLLRSDVSSPFYTAAVFFFMGLLGVLIFNKAFPDHHRKVPESAPQPNRSFSPWQQLKTWRVLMTKLWPLFVFSVILSSLDSVFLTIGPLLTEELQQRSFWGHFVIVAYLFPSLFIGLLLNKVSQRVGKKRVAFITAGIGGAFLFLSGLISEPLTLILFFLIASSFFALSFPAISATVQDYMSRLSIHKDDIVGLETSATSLGFLIGQIGGGAAAYYAGNQGAFGVFGLLLFGISMWALVVVPRKIRLPQMALSEV